MKGFKKLGILLIILVVVVVAFYIKNSYIQKENIENDARVSQRISNDFQVSRYESKNVVAMLFYSEEDGDHTFSVYVKNSGILGGYSFKYGGGLGEIKDGIASFNIGEIKDRIYLSMNKDKIEKIELSNGIIININSTKPFSIIDENATRDAVFYNGNGEIIDDKIKKKD